MAVSKKIPERMCVVCRQKFPKTQLIRLVLIDHKITIDTSQKLSGRGVWIDKSPQCLSNLQKKKVLNKIFKSEIDASLYQQLEELING